MKSLFKSTLIIIIIAATTLFSCSKKESIFNGEFVEKKLALPYLIEGKLTQNGEQYDVLINGDNYTENLEGSRFRIQFLSGDVTEGLTVEFFDNGVFLFFDDLRFKTNSTMFTNLGQLKTAFNKLSEPYTEKTVEPASPVSGIDLLEIKVQTETDSINAYINKNDGSIIRLITGNGESAIILDISKFETVSEPIAKDVTEPQSVDQEVIDEYFDD